jgi:hypothetical protein
MDEGSGTTVTDAVSGTLQGTLYGGVEWKDGGVPFDPPPAKCSIKKGSSKMGSIYGQRMEERCCKKTLTTLMSGVNNLFNITGPIQLIELIGVVKTDIQGKSCLINYSMLPTTPAAATVFGINVTALEINADAAGTLYTWDGVVANNLTAITNGVALGLAAPKLILPAGVLRLAAVVATSATGAIDFYIRYKPLVAGASVSPA